MKRRVIIRESDFKRIPHFERKKYDRISFTPITQEWLQKQVTWHTMRGNKKVANDYRHWPYPSHMIDRFYKIRLHDVRYKWWLIDYNDQGQMRIRSGLNQPSSLLGIAVYEKDDELAESDT